MKKLFITLSMLLAATIMMAGNRPLAEMQAIAAKKLNALAVERGQRNAPAKSTELRCLADKEAYTVFSSEATQGFVIVAKSTKVDPIIGYSTESFDTKTISPELKWYLSEVNRNLQAIEAGEIEAPKRAATYTRVKNFVKTKWNQDAPYNALTPNNYPTGCVATALAQCLNYCQYPSSVDFDGEYFIVNGNNYESFNEHVSSTYTWPYENSYKGKTPNDNIAELMRDCGYATYMQYTSDGSGTTTMYAGMALTQTFGYPQECIKFYDKDYWGKSDDEWKQIIYDELALKCPILYAAHPGDEDSEGGHAFVFSGVDADGKVYVNWGWGGDQNGYFSIDVLILGKDIYTKHHKMITGFRTTPLATDHVEPRIRANYGGYTFRWDKEREGKKSYNSLHINIPGGFENYTPSDFEGVFGIFAQDLTDGTTWIIAEDLQDPDTIPASHGYYLKDETKPFEYYYDVTGDKGLKPGHTYRMSFGTKDNREGIWHSIICYEGEIGYDITYTGDPKTSTVSESPTSVPVLTDITGINDIVAQKRTDKNWYDLHGRRLATPQKGINIMNGKKIFVK